MVRTLLLVPLMVLACQPGPPQTAPAPAAARPWRAAAFSAARSDAFWLDNEPLGPDLGLAAGDVADSTVERLLAHRFTLPHSVTVGILHLPGARARRSLFSGTDVADLTQALADSTRSALSRSPRIARAAVLPALVIGDEYTVAGLREAAARLQADVLMVYRPSCRFYERVPFLASSQYRAVCTIEAVVLDTRSGVMPFSTVMTRDAITQRQRSDFDLNGTWRRVQLEAMVAAAVELSNRVGSFLTGVPEPEPR